MEKKIFSVLRFRFLPLWVIVGIFEVAERYFTGVLVQQTLDAPEMLAGSILTLTTLFLVNYLLRHCCTYFHSRKIENAVMQIRKKLFENILSAPYHQLAELTKGEIITKLVQNLKKIQDYEQNEFPAFTRSLVQGVLALIVCIWISPVLSLILFLSIPLMVVCNVLASLPGKKLVNRRNSIENEMNSYAQNRLENIQTVKAYSLEEESVEGYQRHLNDFYRQNVKIAGLRAKLTILDGVNYILPYVLIFGGATILAVQGSLLPGEIVSFTYLMNFITNAIGDMQRFLYESHERKDAADRIDEILELETEIREKQPVQSISAGKIKIKGLSFSYGTDNTENVVEEITLTINEGEKIAFVGENGSGKSTLLKLIGSLYHEYNGVIEVDDTGIAYVDQENFILPASVADNIRGVKSELDIDSVKQATVRAGIAGFVEQLPEGYDTVVDASRLSGGEKQRLCLARAYAQGKSILLLDEPSSALDKENEEILWKEIGKESHQTVIMVTHSLRHMDIFDKIFVMQKGRIVETGKHSNLYQRQGVYYKICNVGGSQNGKIIS